MVDSNTLRRAGIMQDSVDVLIRTLDLTRHRRGIQKKRLFQLRASHSI